MPATAPVRTTRTKGGVPAAGYIAKSRTEGHELTECAAGRAVTADLLACLRSQGIEGYASVHHVLCGTRKRNCRTAAGPLEGRKRGCSCERVVPERMAATK
jgi:hypothetical protein